VGTGCLFPGGKARPGRNADHSSATSAKVVNEQELYSSPPKPSMVCSGTALLLLMTFSSVPWTEIFTGGTRILRNSLPYVEPESSLSCLQELATGRYPKPHASCPPLTLYVYDPPYCCSCRRGEMSELQPSTAYCPCAGWDISMESHDERILTEKPKNSGKKPVWVLRGGGGIHAVSQAHRHDGDLISLHFFFGKESGIKMWVLLLV
jgi:hypothetical protein